MITPVDCHRGLTIPKLLHPNRDFQASLLVFASTCMFPGAHRCSLRYQTGSCHGDLVSTGLASLHSQRALLSRPQAYRVSLPFLKPLDLTFPDCEVGRQVAARPEWERTLTKLQGDGNEEPHRRPHGYPGLPAVSRTSVLSPRPGGEFREGVPLSFLLLAVIKSYPKAT